MRVIDCDLRCKNVQFPQKEPILNISIIHWNNMATYCTCFVVFFVFSASQSKIKTWEIG